MSQAIRKTAIIDDPLATNSAGLKPLEWWDCGLPCPRPDELFIHAALNDSRAIYLQTPEDLDRVAESYIAHCRRIGYWAHTKSEVPYHATGEQGYRHRLADYKAVLSWWLLQTAGGATACA